MIISHLIDNLKEMLEKHGDIQVKFWASGMYEELQVDVVEFEAEDRRAARHEPHILLGE